MSSPALRALAAAKVIAKALGHKGKSVVVNDRLYACTADDLVHVIEALDDKLERVVGHRRGPTHASGARWSERIIVAPSAGLHFLAGPASRWARTSAHRFRRSGAGWTPGTREACARPGRPTAASTARSRAIPTTRWPRPAHRAVQLPHAAKAGYIGGKGVRIY